MALGEKLKKLASLNEDRKADLIEQKELLQEEYKICVAALGESHPQCQLLLGIIMQICAEIEMLCSSVEGTIPSLLQTMTE